MAIAFLSNAFLQSDYFKWTVTPRYTITDEKETVTVDGDYTIEEEKDEYISVMTYYIVKIARLDDKDKDFTKEEFKKELNILVNKQNAELLEILTNEQYAMHTDIYGQFLKAAYNRWGLNE